MKTNVYGDSFNLYYRALKGTPYRWLDMARMCALLLPQHDIQDIKVFTALVKPRPHDPDQPIRQQTYLRALQTLPNLSIVYGTFLSHPVRMPLAQPIPGQATYVEVMKTEEKGSDVNLATHLLNDAHKGRYEAAVVISNDSDLVEPIRIIREELGLTVGVLMPRGQHPSRELQKHATFVKQIRLGVLAASQFPPVLADAHGTIHKPASW